MTSGSGNASNETVTFGSLSELVPLPDSTQDRPGEFFVAEDESDALRPCRLIQILSDDDQDGEGGSGSEARSKLMEILSRDRIPSDSSLLPILAFEPASADRAASVIYGGATSGTDLSLSSAGLSVEGAIEANPADHLDQLVSLASSVAYLHSHGVIHCNLRPSSLLLGREKNGTSSWKLVRTGLRPEPSSIPVTELGFYSEEGSGTSSVALYLNFDAYGQAAEVASLAKLLQWITENTRFAPPGARFLDSAAGFAEEERPLLGHRLRLNQEDLRSTLVGVLKKFYRSAESPRTAENLLLELKVAREVWAEVEAWSGSTIIPEDLVRTTSLSRFGLEEGEFARRVAPQYRAVSPRVVENPLEPCVVRIVGMDLAVGTVIYLRPDESRGAESLTEGGSFGWEIPSGTAAGCGSVGEARRQKLAVLSTKDHATDSPTCLTRVIPPLVPGGYHLFSITEGDTGLRVQVGVEHSEAVPPVFESIEPTVIKDPGKEATLTIRGRGLRNVGVMHLDREGELVISADGSRYVPLRRVEDSIDTDREIFRVVPPFARAGIYRLVHEGNRVGLSFEAKSQRTVFTGLEPQRVHPSGGFTMRVTGRALPSTRFYELLDRDGQAAVDRAGRAVRLEAVVRGESRDRLELLCREPPCPGVYVLAVGGQETGLDIVVVPKLESSSPRRLHTSGKRPQLRLRGEAFSPMSTYSLQGEKRGDRIVFEDLAVREGEVELTLPRVAAPDRYQILIDGVETGTGVRIGRFSRTVNSFLTAMVCFVFLLGGLAGIPWAFRTEYTGIAPARIYVVAADGRVVTKAPVEVYGSHLKEKTNYVLVSIESEDVRIGLSPDGVDRGGARLTFLPFPKIPIGAYTEQEFELCLVDAEGVIDVRTGTRVLMSAFDANVDSLSGAGVSFDGKEYYRRADRSREDLSVGLTGIGLSVLRTGSVLLDPPHTKLTVAEIGDDRAILRFENPENVEPGLTYHLTFSPDAEGSPIPVGTLHLDEYVGFDGLSPESSGEWEVEAGVYNLGCSLYVLAASEAVAEEEGLEFRLCSESGATWDLSGFRPPVGGGRALRLDLPVLADLTAGRRLDLEFKTAARPEFRNTMLSIAVYPEPSFTGFGTHEGAVEPVLSVGLSPAEEAETVVRFYGRGLPSIREVSLRAVDSPTVETDGVGHQKSVAVAAKLEKDEGGDYWRIEIPTDPELFEGSFEIDYISAVSGETESIEGAMLSFYDLDVANGIARRASSVGASLCAGRISEALREAEALLTKTEARDWAPAVSPAEASHPSRDLVAFERFVGEWIFRGQQQQAASDALQSIDDTALTVAVRRVIDAERCIAYGAARTEEAALADFAALTGNRDGDWITPVVRAYEAYLDVTLNRRLDRWSETVRLLEDLEGRFALAPFWIWDLKVYRAAHDRRGGLATIQSLLGELGAVSREVAPEIAELFEAYYRCRGRLWSLIRSGEPGDIARDVVLTVAHLEEANPALCASLIVQANSVNLVSFDAEQTPVLRETFDRVVGKLDETLAGVLVNRLR